MLFSPLLQSKISSARIIETTEKTWVEVCKQAENCVVQVFSYVGVYNLLEPFKTPSQLESRGSGFFISEDGEILTNFHVINQSIATYIQIPALGKDQFKVEFMGACPEKDFAKIKLTPKSLEKIKQKLNMKTLPYLQFGDSDALGKAQEIMALGFPLGEENLKVSIGRLAGRESTRIGECIQTTTAINPGNSGGPILNQQGEVIGLATLKVANTAVEGIAYLIPINNVLIMMEYLQNKEIINTPFWGCLIIPTTSHTLAYLENPIDGGVYVIEVKEGSLTEECGMIEGDVLYKINGEKIDKYGYLNVDWSSAKIHVHDFISRLAFGSTIEFTIYRNGIKLKLYSEIKNSNNFSIKQYHPWIMPLLDYEIIGGMVITPLTTNHIAFFKKLNQRSNVDISSIEKHLKRKKQIEPRLIITTAYPSSLFHKARCFAGGDRIIDEVNGIKVSTLSELRKAIKQNKDDEYLTIKTQLGSFSAIPLKQALEEEILLSTKFSYPITQLVLSLYEEVKTLDLLKEVASN